MALEHLERLCCPRYRPAERDFLPELWEAFQYKDKRSDRLWKRDATLEDNLRSLVEVITSLLPPVERWAGRGACMPFILHRVQKQKYVYTERKSIHSTRRGYVHLALFYRPPHLEVRISAHRFLLWAMRGMPPDDQRVLALHICAPYENSACVARAHLAWGTPADNSRHYRQRGLDAIFR